MPGEVVVQELIDRFGNRKKGWPKKLLKSLEERNAALLAAIQERVCFVPKDLFWPLGQACKDVLTGKYDEEAEREAKAAKEAEKKAKEAAAAAAAAAGASDDGGSERDGGGARGPVGAKGLPLAAAADAAREEEQRRREEEEARARDEGPSPRRYYRDSSDDESEEGRRANMLGKLQGYDYRPQQTGGTASVRGEGQYPDDASEYPEEPLSEYGGRGAGAGSDDDSDIVTLRGTVLYDFEAQEEDEVAVAKGEAVEVVYEVGGWLQVITPSGARGLVPKTYVTIHEEEEEARADDTRSISSRASSVFGETQADAAADYNSFLAR
ncbi:hypothetical protein MNEG_14998 [Monoraphidium neglectum]|uniref:SH3 domain-containing protein n=1 Tax=Monoraphidium neglectum TaxID=145388 RepID=A0A0D2MCG6_9CHLO|nr:hypothetical protein MNEG_14998 [Monoraphidium neglectum]KIY92965.1 hypothetical protein MNEG_14998 [Monoraphidium neglectum]|eukprot:XP_013891985.1 hypothetical protein MNEG_14998 [Monoraphidium neglectum]